jgi:hypothetical protein
VSERHTVLSMFPDLVPDAFVGPLPMSIQTGTNADIVYQFRHLYFANDRTIIDLTPGDNLGWWNRHQPAKLTLSPHDFTALPYDSDAFQTVCYDPPYIPQGGIGSINLSDFRERYGLTPRNEHHLLELILAGASEAARITNKRDGYLCIKAMDFVNGGSFTPWTYRIWQHMNGIGMYLHDEITHHSRPGPGGHNISVPKRARRAHSKLLVFTWSRR